MNFQYKKFVKEIHKAQDFGFSIEEVEGILGSEEDYIKDTPRSTGNRLIITGVHFKGQKTGGPVINFSQNLHTGINIWVADNLTGKSSLFKIITLALTGNNKLKPNVKRWVKEVLVSFKVSNRHFSTYLDLTGSRMSAKVFNKLFHTIDDVLHTQTTPLINVKSQTDYASEIQTFFFQEFSYYRLSWTQKNSSKDSNELTNAGTSWKTYFKSIFLESKDSHEMVYGGQGKKIFQMLLGLQLTYPINKLTVEQDHSRFNKSKKKNIYYSQARKDKLNKQLSELNQRLKELDAKQAKKLNLTPLYKEYNAIQNKIKEINTQRNILQNEFQENQKRLHDIAVSQNTNQEAQQKLQQQIIKTQKQIRNLQEHIEIGIFFSNLDIKQCPNCNREVGESDKRAELTHHQCSLCHEPIRNDASVNKEVYEQKIKNLEQNANNFSIQQAKLKQGIQALNHSYNQLNNKKNTLSTKFQTLESIEPHKKRLFALEQEINQKKDEAKPTDEQRYKIISDRAVIEFQLKQFEENEEDDKAESKIKLLTLAIQKLEDYRQKMGQDILHNLSQLMLTEIHQFGLQSITDIQIKENFEIVYQQDGDYLPFSQFAEGEKLRAKIAFYLSLIQLDIDHNYGRHTRFLIIDSPSKEEGDSKYLNGLMDTLQSIENRYGDQLQILIGTAERSFVGCFPEKEMVKRQGEYVF